MEQYQQQIEPEATHAVVPEEIHPVAAAFGGDIGQAIQRGGEEVASRLQGLAVHLARMNYYRGEAQRADIVNNYKTGLQTQLMGDPGNPNATTTYTPNVDTKGLTFSVGQRSDISNVAPVQNSIERPLGVYKWTGNMASGALDYIDQWHHQAVDQAMQQAQGLGLKNNAILISQLDKAWASERNSVVSHETTEINKAQIQTYMKGMQLDADNAVTKQDPISLGRTIDSINQQNKILNDSQFKAPDDPIRQLTSDKFVNMALNNSMNAILRTSNDPTQAQAIVDKLHENGKINDTVYDNVSEHIDKSYKALTVQNERAQRIQQTNNRMGMMAGAVEGKLDLTNQNNLNAISEQDPEAGTAIENYNLNKTEIIKQDDEAFASATKKMFELGSKEQVAKYSLNVLNEGKISQDRLNILFAAAIDRGKNLADLEGDAQKHNPLQNMIDGGMKALFGWNKDQGKHDGQTYADYMQSIKAGKSANEAYSSAIGNSAIRSNPSITTIPITGKIMIDKNGNRATVYPDGHFEEIGGKKQPEKKEDNGI